MRKAALAVLSAVTVFAVTAPVASAAPISSYQAAFRGCGWC